MAMCSVQAYTSVTTTGNKKGQIQLCSNSAKPGSTAARNLALHGYTPLGASVLATVRFSYCQTHAFVRTHYLITDLNETCQYNAVLSNSF